MSGHSKWATIKHRKGLADVKRGKLFSKIAKEIAVAARMGGSDTASNPRLKTAIMTARDSSMPNKNIENAIRKGSGENKEGVVYFEITYEGYGPFGVAILIDCLTDNKNRSVAEVRKIFTKNNCTLGEVGSVGWQFEKKGVIHIEKNIINEEAILEMGIDLSLDDVIVEEQGYTLYTQPDKFITIYDELKKRSLEFINAEITMIPKNTIKIDSQQAEKVREFIDTLDDLEDVKSVSSNEELAQ